MLPDLKLSYYNFAIPYPEKQVYIIYNSLSNGMIELDWETGLIVSKLNSMEIHYLDADVIEVLQRNGMIIPREIDEFVEVKKRADTNRATCDRSDTLFMVISPTNTCNMNCPYCYQGDKTPGEEDTKYLGPENMEAMKKMITQIVYQPHATPIKNIRIEWFGGEPLIRKKTIAEFSEFVIALSKENGIDYQASIITNGTLLDVATFDMLEKYHIRDLQITIDGSKEMHNSMRYYINGKGTYDRILDHLSRMPFGKFYVTIRINGDKAVYRELEGMFDDLEAKGIWPQRDSEVTFSWSPKFYNFLGYNQDKDVYYTSYEYQKSKEDFTKLKVERFNRWASQHSVATKRLNFAYPSFAEFYCGTVESPNSISVDDSGYIHKCYNTINDKTKRIQHVSEFDPTQPGMDYYRHFDKTQQPDCRTCKVLPICEENCNMRFVSNAESKVCSAWKYFMEERMRAIYDYNFTEEQDAHTMIARNGTVETC
ncbi:radical SAM protein with 4Fe4S-binding SPASM domain [Chitinophaga skermanii]|uniref:Radical SAM protein with 4Fe4S-binding SPASM domain n=1 Tax=Chitinophaga skermanii TaxID=331697 RepID=A0A327R366_9BACT|nr:radical SAM protein [Chitinophaga skermanii]RAJ08327.1 radical SAM protein with 4Fe4S-binding SPASM domain [Chitinophaga skermanii]